MTSYNSQTCKEENKFKIQYETDTIENYKYIEEEIRKQIDGKNNTGDVEYELGFAQGQYEKEQDLLEIINLMAQALSEYGYDKTFISGQAFTEWECKQCHKKFNWHNTKVPKMCPDCIKEKFMNKVGK